MRRTGRLDPALVTAVAIWLAVVIGPPLALLEWRERRLPAVSGDASQADWDEFRDDMRRQSGREGPVQHKVPKSSEPPELVWLRDHVALAVIAWMTLAGVLGGFLAVVFVGAVRQGIARTRPQ